MDNFVRWLLNSLWQLMTILHLYAWIIPHNMQVGSFFNTGKSFPSTTIQWMEFPQESREKSTQTFVKVRLSLLNHSSNFIYSCKINNKKNVSSSYRFGFSWFDMKFNMKLVHNYNKCGIFLTLSAEVVIMWHNWNKRFHMDM